MKRASFIAAVALLAGSATAASTLYDFETDQSGSFTAVEFEGTTAGADTATNYQYDYSGDGIGTAPSGSGQTGLRSEANLSQGEGNSITYFPDTTGLNVADGTWVLTFDLYAKFGDNAGATTEFYAFGAAASTSDFAVGSDGGDGFNYICTVDGGSSNDYRYFDGTSSPITNDNTIPNWFGSSPNNDNGSTDWSNFFTSPPYDTAGCAGEEWVTVRLTVTNGGADREVAFSRPADAGVFTVASTITGGTGSAANPAVGHADFFSSVNTNQWMIFDNILIEDDPATAGVNDWTLYNK